MTIEIYIFIFSTAVFYLFIISYCVFRFYVIKVHFLFIVSQEDHFDFMNGCPSES